MTEFDNATWLWIDSHAHDDVNRLRLSHSQSPVKMDAIIQIECRQKNAKKLRDTLANKRFRFPNTLSAEQSTSDILAHFHASLVPAGATLLDMTCGLGIDAFHIAKKASSIIACEQNPDVARTARYNAGILQLSNIDIECCDSTDFVRNTTRQFDCIFIDPARRGTGGKRLFALSDCSPNVTALIDRLFELAPLVIIKASPMLDITHTLQELPCVQDIYAVGSHAECKEIVVVCSLGYASSPTITAITFDNGNKSVFSYMSHQEQNAVVATSGPVIGNILYEPYPAVMKTAPFKLLSTEFHTHKLDKNTHLYLSPVKIDFPGRGYDIIDIFSLNKSDIKRLSGEYPAYDITVRNFPLKASELEKKLKHKSNGTLHLFAVTLQNGSHALIMTKPVSK